jgi:hypothetical protein
MTSTEMMRVHVEPPLDHALNVVIQQQKLFDVSAIHKSFIRDKAKTLERGHQSGEYLAAACCEQHVVIRHETNKKNNLMSVLYL